MHGVCKRNIREYSCTCNQGYEGSICDKSKFEIYFGNIIKNRYVYKSIKCIHNYVFEYKCQ